MLKLSELQQRIGRVLGEEFADSVWVACEVQSLNTSSGHCYMELAEYDEAHMQRVAVARATIWRGQYLRLRSRFETLTGQELCAGLQVLLCVRVAFHAVYGLSLNVVDIDPSYTLGDIERRRREIWDRLKREGVAEMQKELELPTVVQRVAVISSATAAGYGDFMNQLKGNRRGYAFCVKLFPALMQGAEAGKSIVAALDAVCAEEAHWDTVVIIRGGGAVGDLQSLESYEVANNIAQFPLPVLTGIGHDRDQTLLDMVAHMALRTPTAVAEFLVGRIEQTEERAEALGQSIVVAVGRRLAAEGKMLAARGAMIEVQVRNRLTMGLQFVEQWLGLRLLPRVAERLHRERLRLEASEKAVNLADPEAVLRRGFTLTRVDGRVVTSARVLKAGDVLETRFADGEVESVVTPAGKG